MEKKLSSIDYVKEIVLAAILFYVFALIGYRGYELIEMPLNLVIFGVILVVFKYRIYGVVFNNEKIVIKRLLIKDYSVKLHEIEYIEIQDKTRYLRAGFNRIVFKLYLKNSRSISFNLASFYDDEFSEYIKKTCLLNQIKFSDKIESSNK